MLWHGDKYKEGSVETHLLNLALTFAVIMLLPAEMSFAMPPEPPVNLHATGVVSLCALSREETAAQQIQKRGEKVQRCPLNLSGGKKNKGEPLQEADSRFPLKASR